MLSSSLPSQTFAIQQSPQSDVPRRWNVHWVKKYFILDWSPMYSISLDFSLLCFSLSHYKLEILFTHLLWLLILYILSCHFILIILCHLLYAIYFFLSPYSLLFSFVFSFSYLPSAKWSMFYVLLFFTLSILEVLNAFWILFFMYVKLLRYKYKLYVSIFLPFKQKCH